MRKSSQRERPYGLCYVLNERRLRDSAVTLSSARVLAHRRQSKNRNETVEISYRGALIEVLPPLASEAPEPFPGHSQFGG